MTDDARRLWRRTSVYVCVAAALLAFAQGSVQPRVPTAAGVAIGLGAAAVLFVGLSRARARLRPRRRRAHALIARGAFYTLRSACEEVAWRWFLLGSLIPAVGMPGAFAASTAGFAVAHAGPRSGRTVAVHACTGGIFAGVFVATGSLLAAVVAHGGYNLLVLLAVESDCVAAVPESVSVESAGHDPPPVALLRNVSKRYRSAEALHEVDLELRPGEVVALLGANGAGKTTAISVLLGLRRPDSGIARLYGRDPRLPAARRRIGVTPQELGFPSTLTVAEIVDFVRAHFPEPEPRDQLIRRFGLEEVRDRQAGGLSGGQRRRLSLALAFAPNPAVMFLDEPTTGLDVASRLAAWNAIRAFGAGGGTVLLTTHNLDEAEALADRVIVMSEGRVIADASLTEIKSHAGLRRIRLRSQALPRLAGVRRVVDDGDRRVLYVTEVGHVVEELVRAEADLKELEVLPVSLEEAFIALTEGGP
ncbi:MAG: type transport system ATP-binding protein [Gaiellaceae bacterium]|nr:type transport system ATP-binding protein [Gaiellaceae bacterium]